MDNERLIEIKNRLAVLPALEERMEKLRHRTYEAENDVQSLLHKLEAESLDVEELKRESLSVTLLKLIGRYEGKLNKETQEMLNAKMEYDKASERVKELYAERNDLGKRISELRQVKQTYEAELRRREEAIISNINDEVSIKYRQLEEVKEALAKQLVETDEALHAASRAKSTINSAMEHLDSAESWATYDVWFDGGIFSHMAKYEHIDDAEAAFNRLHSQLKDLKNELSDVNFTVDPEIGRINSTTRTVDFWFDNIFTDLNVRDKIRGDLEQLSRLSGKIESVMSRLEKNKSEINKQFADIEQRKNDLIISG